MVLLLFSLGNVPGNAIMGGTRRLGISFVISRWIREGSVTFTRALQRWVHLEVRAAVTGRCLAVAPMARRNAAARRRAGAILR